MFQLLEERYKFNIVNDIYIEVKTDFEIIQINTNNPNNYFLQANNLLRFITDEFEDEYSCEDNNIHAVYFIPSHKEKEFSNSLENSVLVEEMDKYYTDEMKTNFESYDLIPKGKALVPHKERSKHGSSFYGVEEDVQFEVLINTAKEILSLNAMKNHKIAIGSINENFGLLEKGERLKTETPQSKHYNFWKFCETITGKTFFDLAKEFRMVV